MRYTRSKLCKTRWTWRTYCQYFKGKTQIANERFQVGPFRWKWWGVFCPIIGSEQRRGKLQLHSETADLFPSTFKNYFAVVNENNDERIKKYIENISFKNERKRKSSRIEYFWQLLAKLMLAPKKHLRQKPDKNEVQWKNYLWKDCCNLIFW